MPFIDFEDLDLVLGSTVTPNPDFHELELSLNDSSYHPSLPKQTRLLHVLHPFDATTTGAPYDRIPSPCPDPLASSLSSTTAYATCDFTALSHAAYVLGICAHPQKTDPTTGSTCGKPLADPRGQFVSYETRGPKPANSITRASCDTCPL